MERKRQVQRNTYTQPPLMAPITPTQKEGTLRIRSTKGFTWAELEPADIGRLVLLVTSVGNAIILGVTSDGGALAVTILQGEERIKDWPKDPEAFQQLLAWAEGAYDKL